MHTVLNIILKNDIAQELLYRHMNALLATCVMMIVHMKVYAFKKTKLKFQMFQMIA